MLTLRHAADLSHEALGVIHLARQRPEGWCQSGETSNACHCSQGRQRLRGTALLLPALPSHGANDLLRMFQGLPANCFHKRSPGAKLLHTSLCQTFSEPQ